MEQRILLQNQSYQYGIQDSVPYNYQTHISTNDTIVPTLSKLHDSIWQQYFQPLQFYNCSYLENPQMPYFKPQIYSKPTIQTQSSIKSDKTNSCENNRVRDRSIQNIENNLSDFTKLNNSTTQSQGSIRVSRKNDCQDGESSNKILKNKNKISKGSQNRNRNIIPSIVQQIFSYLSKPNKSRSIVEKIFSDLEKPDTSSISIRRYYYFIKHIKQKLNHYLNTNSISILWKIQTNFTDVISEEEQRFYLNIARRVTKHFLENLLPLLIIHSKRMFEDKRAEHLKVRRILLDALHQLH